MIKFLSHGSPAIRLVFQMLREWRILEPPDPKYKSHQKVILAVSVPISAWFLEIVFKACLIGAAAFHSGLSHEERASMVKTFNDPNSTLKILIMTYDVGAVGLNLHHACNRVIILDPGASRAAESQLAGRALQVCSEPTSKTNNLTNEF